jgi:hypothetical protein
VYVALVVLVEAARLALAAAARSPAPRRTVRRWLDWFRHEFVRSDVFTAVRGLFSPPPVTAAIPAALVERFAPPARSSADVLVAVLAFLSPLGASPALRRARLTREG